MTKPKPKPLRAVDAVREAVSRESARRVHGLKPIEIVKIVICAYQDYTNDGSARAEAAVESADRAGLRRGTQASVDRLLFNANYWLAAYEDRIVRACAPADARVLLKAVTVWSTHTLKLNTLNDDEVIATFERFCPPFAANNRRGTAKGKGPVVQFEAKAREVASRHPDCGPVLAGIVADMNAEATAYAELPAATALDVLYAILPVWCLRDDIGLVSGSWWDDVDVMTYLADALRDRFVEIGYGDVPCQYFHDSMLEAIDAYQRDVSASRAAVSDMPAHELVGVVHTAREANPEFETDGYGDMLPAWLSAKEQLIWNVLVCSLYGPGSARPLLAPFSSLTPGQGMPQETRLDIITTLAKLSFERYNADRASYGEDRGYASFSNQPQDLRNSSIEHVKSIPRKLDVLGYEMVPAGSCYPEQRIDSFTSSEVECLAVLEHRRWIEERTKAGWVYGPVRDVEAKTSPYLVPWENLPDRAREWNRSAVRNIPALLGDEGLAIARK